MSHLYYPEIERNVAFVLTRDVILLVKLTCGVIIALFVRMLFGLFVRMLFG